jgi:hypothetical protein
MIQISYQVKQEVMTSPSSTATIKGSVRAYNTTSRSQTLQMEVKTIVKVQRVTTWHLLQDLLHNTQGVICWELEEKVEYTLRTQ